jgi:hypothetical protein
LDFSDEKWEMFDRPSRQSSHQRIWISTVNKRTKKRPFIFSSIRSLVSIQYSIYSYMLVCCLLSRISSNLHFRRYLCTRAVDAFEIFFRIFVRENFELNWIDDFYFEHFFRNCFRKWRFQWFRFSTLHSSIVADFFTIVSFFSARLQFLWVEKVKYPRNFVDIYTNSDWNMKIWTSEHIFW